MQRMLRDMAIFCEICGRESMKSACMDVLKS